MTGETTASADSQSIRDRLLTAPVAAAAGVLVSGGLGAADLFWPALTVLAGALAASGLLLARRDGRKRYLLAGVAYCLGLAVLVEFGSGAFPSAYVTGVLPAAGGLGAISGLLIVGKVVGKRAVERLAVVLGNDEAFWGRSGRRWPPSEACCRSSGCS